MKSLLVKKLLPLPLPLSLKLPLMRWLLK